VLEFLTTDFLYIMPLFDRSSNNNNLTPLVVDLGGFHGGVY
jgi:hypothetical protein